MQQCIEKVEGFIKKNNLSNLVLMGVLMALIGLATPIFLVAEEVSARSEQTAQSIMLVRDFKHRVRSVAPSPISSAAVTGTSTSADMLVDIQAKIAELQKQHLLDAFQKLSQVQMILNQIETVPTEVSGL